MDSTFSPEQVDLADTVTRLAERLGPSSVEALADGARRTRLAQAVTEAGLLDLRRDDGVGSPVATGVEVGIVAGIFGRLLVDTRFLGSTLAMEAFRLAGVEPPAGDYTIALDPAGSAPANWKAAGTTASLVVDAAPFVTVLGLIPDHDGFLLATAEAGESVAPVDLTRGVAVLGDDRPLRVIPDAHLERDAVARLVVLGQVIAAQDLAGVAQGALDLAVGYAKERRQYGSPIGAFQAVQHMLAEATALCEGAASVALFAAWSYDGAESPDSERAARVAKAYCARAARRVCETTIQVHGGIGNTWECLAHVYLRRALHSAELFGSEARQLEHLAAELLSA